VSEVVTEFMFSTLAVYEELIWYSAVTITCGQCEGLQILFS